MTNFIIYDLINKTVDGEIKPKANLQRAKAAEILAVIGLDKWTPEGEMKSRVSGDLSPGRAEYLSTYAHVTGQGMCLHSDEVGVPLWKRMHINQGGTADFTSVLVEGQAFFVMYKTFIRLTDGGRRKTKSLWVNEKAL